MYSHFYFVCFEFCYDGVVDCFDYVSRSFWRSGGEGTFYLRDVEAWR